jgi:hypothetical protein
MKKEKKNIRIIAIDPGNTISGVVVLSNGEIEQAQNANNVGLFDQIVNWCTGDYVVIIEDLKPYSVPLRQQTIDTAKFIGVLQWRLEQAGIKPQMASRSEVKTWAFNRFPGVCVAEVEKKIAKKASFPACDVKSREEIMVKKDGKTWKAIKPSHVYVDDRILITCMKVMWAIENPKPGKSNRYGVSRHSWQALALGSMAM